MVFFDDNDWNVRDIKENTNIQAVVVDHKKRISLQDINVIFSTIYDDYFCNIYCIK